MLVTKRVNISYNATVLAYAPKSVMFCHVQRATTHLCAVPYVHIKSSKSSSSSHPSLWYIDVSFFSPTMSTEPAARGAGAGAAAFLIGVSGTSNKLEVATPGRLAGCNTLDRFGVGKSLSVERGSGRFFIGVSNTSLSRELNELVLAEDLTALIGMAGESGAAAIFRAIIGDEGGIICSSTADLRKKFEAEEDFLGVCPTTSGADFWRASLWLLRGNVPGTAGPMLEGGMMSSVEGRGISGVASDLSGMAFLKRGFAGVAFTTPELAVALVPFRGSDGVSELSNYDAIGRLTFC